MSDPAWLQHVIAALGEPRHRHDEEFLWRTDERTFRRRSWTWFVVVEGRLANHHIAIDRAVWDPVWWVLRVSSAVTWKHDVEVTLNHEPRDPNVQRVLDFVRFTELTPPPEEET